MPRRHEFICTALLENGRANHGVQYRSLGRSVNNHIYEIHRIQHSIICILSWSRAHFFVYAIISHYNPLYSVFYYSLYVSIVEYNRRRPRQWRPATPISGPKWNSSVQDSFSKETYRFIRVGAFATQRDA